jgi:hypothetical protein
VLVTFHIDLVYTAQQGQVIFVNDYGVVLWDFDIDGSLSRYHHRYIGILDDMANFGL